MNRLRRHAALRFYLRHPGQLALALAGIALGVAVVVAIDLANATSLRAFELSRELTSNRASHYIEGAGEPLDEAVYTNIRTRLGVDLAAPVVEGRVTLPDEGGRSVTLLGVDPIAELAFDDSLRLARQAADGQALDVRPLIAEPAAVLLPEALASSLGLRAGDRLRVSALGDQHLLTVSGVVTLEAGRGSGASGPIIADVSTAQEVLGRLGQLSRIEIAADEPAAARIAAALPPGAALVPADSSDDVTGQMLRAFRINLTALSLLALVVGMLLIYATMSFAVVQRRRSLGTLRALGATRRDIAGDVLTESVILGLIATAAGLVLGWVLSRSLTDLVLATINDLYFTARIAPEGIAWLPFAKAGVLGIGATMIAALRPAVEAANEPPRTAMTDVAYERSMQRRFAAGPAVAAGAFIVAACLIAWPGAGLVPAFAGLFAVLAGYALLVPSATARLLAAAQAAGGRRLGLPVRMAVRGAVASLSRTGIAVTALAVAVATVVGIGVMIDSFRGSVTRWLDQSLIADYYLVTEGETGRGFTREEITRLAGIEGVAGTSLSRTMTLPSEVGEIAVRAAKAGPKGYGETLVAGDPETAFEALAGGDAILLAEAFASLSGLGVGDKLTLPTTAGPRAFRVTGIFRDYRTAGSSAMLPYGVVSDLWGYRPPYGVGIYRADGADRAAIESALGDFAAARGDIQLAANEEIRRVTLNVFDQTFEITSVLRLLAGIIAFFGILSALLALQLERRREVATLRAIGFTRRQTGANALAQTTLLGLVSGLLALPLGVVLAALLIYVINQRSFGWTMGFVVAPGQLVTGLLLAVLAAFLAGTWPARQLAAQPIAANLRGE
ncbi:MAG: FtsX-like permease family protein [Gammaproteobacteria bacterium]